jgi:hypothetical protein
MTVARRVRVLLFMLAPCGAVACGATTRLSPQDTQSLHDAEAMFYLAYRAKDAGTPGAQFDRAAYCAVDAVLRRSDAGQLDETIVCTRKFK